MKRTPLKRRTPLTSTGKLARGAKLNRGKALRKRNPARAAKRKAECFGAQAEICRRSACCVARAGAPCDGPVQVHHEPPRSVGGTDRDCVPLCLRHHDQRHRVGAPVFWAGYGVEPEQVKASLRAALEVLW